MTRERGSNIRHNDRAVLTTGTFDGVHLGHQAILRYLIQRASDVDGVSTVVTFDPHPRQVIGGVEVPLLTTLDERCELLSDLGIERLVVVPFTRDLAQMEPDAYVRDVLLGTVGMREIVIGYDHRFGRARSGDRNTLESLAAQQGFGVDVIPAHVAEGVTVSSSEIRRLLLDDGDAEAAAALLGRPYSIGGVVVRGAQRGRQLGFPTANIQPSAKEKLVPAVGVYAVRAALEEGQRLDGMMNIGHRPTFDADGNVSIEVNLFEIDADLYGRFLDLQVVARLRGERRFDGAEALARQLREDRGQAENALQSLI